MVATAGAAEGEPCPCAVEEEETAVVDGADGGFGAGEEVCEVRLFADEGVDEGFGVFVGGVVEIVPCVLDGGGGDGLHGGDDQRGAGEGKGSGEVWVRVIWRAWGNWREGFGRGGRPCL